MRFGCVGLRTLDSFFMLGNVDDGKKTGVGRGKTTAGVHMAPRRRPRAAASVFPALELSTAAAAPPPSSSPTPSSIVDANADRVPTPIRLTTRNL
ncbi:hypothetical protein K488DRAFT_84729 [Vararia minispora EC-137]|uniref:Uncharacterized protein n=1 Tax=Vararia minispora EC-137 TaxID=1314806 RepID=A0ACB8QPJ3_9AGAM|nr:hypothetical protein K488DRAFT_84729 [Vararia minispora EC-137]